MSEDRIEAPAHSTPAPRRQSARAGRSRRQSSVLRYIAVLFFAAFVLLLITFIMERRQYQRLQEENQDNIRQSVSATQTLNGILEDNKALQDQVKELEQELARQKAAANEFEAGLDGATAALAHTENVLVWTSQAMDYFWQIDEAYVRGKIGLCRSLIEQLESPDTTPEAGPLAEYLPKESATGNDRFSPYDRYMEIRNKVIK